METLSQEDSSWVQQNSICRFVETGAHAHVCVCVCVLTIKTTPTTMKREPNKQNMKKMKYIKYTVTQNEILMK